MVPAVGATVWGVVYSAGYEAALRRQGPDEGADGTCYGWECYGFWAVGCMVSVWAAIGLWAVAWRMWRRRGVVV